MKTIGVVITGHGDFAVALLGAAELIVGPQVDVEAVCLDPQDSPEIHAAALQAALARVESGAGVLVLTDLFGGTPANTAALALGRGAIAELCGVNLPMLLEVLTSRDESPLPTLAAAALRAGRTGIIDVRAMLDAHSSPASRHETDRP